MAIRLNHLFPECYVDTNILKTLLRLDGVNHQQGCSKVMSGMNSGRFSEGFAIGILDDDKKKTYSYGDFAEICKSERLTVMKHRSKPHYLIFVCKAAEDFLLSCAEELHLRLSDFGLPETLEGLKEVTKNCESDKEPRIRQLVNAVRTSSEMSRLFRVLNYLQEKQYDVTVDELIGVFNS